MAISAAMSYEKIAKYGGDATFRLDATATYAAATGLVTPGAPTDYPVKVVEASATKEFRAVDGVVGASLVMNMSPYGLSFTPSPGHLVIYDGIQYKVLAVHPWKYKGVVVLYEFALGAMA